MPNLDSILASLVPKGPIVSQTSIYGNLDKCNDYGQQRGEVPSNRNRDRGHRAEVLGIAGTAGRNRHHHPGNDRSGVGAAKLTSRLVRRKLWLTSCEQAESILAQRLVTEL